MDWISLLREKNLSVYQCAKESGVPYTTLLDIVKGKTRMEKCMAETIYKLAKTLNVTMEELLAEQFRENEDISNSGDFEIYKSNICHLVKDKGDIDFIIDTLKENQIRIYWERKWYRESFYLLAMVDYLSRENDLPPCNDYEDIRNCTLSEPLYPRDVILAAKLDASLDVKEQCLKEAIPEFMRFNIVESEIRNVC
ncbi:MAG: helix-turn-helix transcriptional regulator [Bacteroidales bacterium]|nr:helix-turn-helix transcriptional regulator [Clostridium sp.]MCM1202761.1 helix-turn-helix transcriptional regulator [Bacteroidales bacterium]